MSDIFALLSLVVSLFLILGFASLFFFTRTVLSNWHHGFDKMQFSSQEFYEAVQKALEEREIRGIALSRTIHAEGMGFFEARREYLRIARNEYFFDVCAAPFANGFFVSWWFIEHERNYKRMLKKIPILKKLMEVKTYFEVDTEQMFRSLVHTCVLQAIDEMTSAKGVRALSEAERRLSEMSHKV